MTLIKHAREVSEVISQRAAEFDETDTFVADNYELLKQRGLVEAGVPKEFGGGGVEIAELCEMLRILAHGCGSTALAFSMHTHQVAIPAWRWRYRNTEAVVPLLKRISSEKLILLSSGGSDWIGGSGRAVKVEGGYRISARKVFSSASPVGDVMMTGALYEEEDGAQSVLHFGIPMNANEVTVKDTWRAMGMRGTGSNDVLINNLFVPDAAIAMSRKAGEWHPVFQIIATMAFPLIYSVYLGVAESARDIAIGIAKKRSVTSHQLGLTGRMETSLRAAQLAHAEMIRTVELGSPSEESINEIMIGKSLLAEHAIRAVELAMELAGGVGFYRDTGLERRFRDIQAARYHPLQAGSQADYAGAMALGQSVKAIY